jgi:hypothetical protein
VPAGNSLFSLNCTAPAAESLFAFQAELLEDAKFSSPTNDRLGSGGTSPPTGSSSPYLESSTKGSAINDW